MCLLTSTIFGLKMYFTMCVLAIMYCINRSSDSKNSTGVFCKIVSKMVLNLFIQYKTARMSNFNKPRHEGNLSSECHLFMQNVCKNSLLRISVVSLHSFAPSCKTCLFWDTRIIKYNCNYINRFVTQNIFDGFYCESAPYFV